MGNIWPKSKKNKRGRVSETNCFPESVQSETSESTDEACSLDRPIEVDFLLNHNSPLVFDDNKASIEQATLLINNVFIDVPDNSNQCESAPPKQLPKITSLARSFIDQTINFINPYLCVVRTLIDQMANHMAEQVVRVTVSEALPADHPIDMAGMNLAENLVSPAVSENEGQNVPAEQEEDHE